MWWRNPVTATIDGCIIEGARADTWYIGNVIAEVHAAMAHVVKKSHSCLHTHAFVRKRNEPHLFCWSFNDPMGQQAELALAIRPIIFFLCYFAQLFCDHRMLTSVQMLKTSRIFLQTAVAHSEAPSPRLGQSPKTLKCQWYLRLLRNSLLRAMWFKKPRS